MRMRSYFTVREVAQGYRVDSVAPQDVDEPGLEPVLMRNSEAAQVSNRSGTR